VVEGGKDQGRKITATPISSLLGRARKNQMSDIPRRAGGLMSGAAQKRPAD
jgi:hypothetical protein